MLRDIAALLGALFRGFYFGRIGADRFAGAGLLPPNTTVSDLIASIDRAVERRFDRLSRRFEKPLTVSTGWASCPREGARAESLLLLAQQRSLERKQERHVSLLDQRRPRILDDVGTAAIG